MRARSLAGPPPSAGPMLEVSLAPSFDAASSYADTLGARDGGFESGTSVNAPETLRTAGSMLKQLSHFQLPTGIAREGYATIQQKSEGGFFRSASGAAAWEWKASSIVELLPRFPGFRLSEVRTTPGENRHRHTRGRTAGPKAVGRVRPYKKGRETIRGRVLSAQCGSTPLKLLLPRICVCGSCCCCWCRRRLSPFRCPCGALAVCPSACLRGVRHRLLRPDISFPILLFGADPSTTMGQGESRQK